MQLAIESSGATSSSSQVRDWVNDVRSGFQAGELAPYLGPGVLSRSTGLRSYEGVAEFLGSKVALPRRARGNLWASAQFIEGRKHRQTLDALMKEAFASFSTPLPIHSYLASLPLPLIVDTWYDGSMRSALATRRDWVEVQGGSRAGIGEARWYRTYGHDGAELAPESAVDATTVLYKPHGAVTPDQNFLVSDADYVEVLTEIDIQTPIPDVVKQRRGSLGFVYLGCRFHDQTLRIFARQIGKRSKGPCFAVVDPAVGMTRNEERFLAESGARLIHASVDEVCAALAQG